MLVSEGDDLRRLPLSMRKTNLARLLARRVDAPFEQGEIGPDLFRHACLMGLEGLVSKHRESLYRGGRFRHWVKIKNRAHPAFTKAALRVKIMLRCVREFSRLRLHFGTGEP
jgi:bifunctional non-homologous end joining protein LigD